MGRAAIVAALTGIGGVASAQQPSAAPISSAAEGTTRAATRANVTVGGYAEFLYQWNFNDPSNGITNDRGYDNRHDSFTLQNVALDVVGATGPVNAPVVSAHITIQYGHTGETYYLEEPLSRGTPGADTSSASVWKYLQQANVAWQAPVGPHGLHIEGGLFLSPIGPESIPIKDQWNWSRSTLFFVLPAYHTGLRATYAFTDRTSVSLAAYNGWNSVVDNNEEKSVSAHVTYNVADHLTAQFLYFGGIERPPGTPDGQPWRSLFDAYVTLYARPWLSLMAHADGGFESGALGDSGWAGGAAYGRVRMRPWLFVAARSDFLWQHTPTGATPVLYPVPWVLSETLTFDARPADTLSLRLEHRHDQADGPLYFDGAVATDPSGAFVPNAKAQDTVTFGMVAWF